VPRRRSLTLPAIAAAALAVVDRDGAGGLSMRSLATELGAGTMSLYRYVEGREQVEALVVDLVLGEIDVAVPPGEPWTARLATLAWRARDAIGDHPAVVPLLLTSRHMTPGTVRWGESVLEVLAGAGFTGDDRVVAFRTLLGWLLGAVQVEHLGSLSGAGTAALAQLPAELYPHVADTAAHAGTMDPDDDFRRGLEIVLRGLVPPGS
jgi:AcrR family transcriptional regulator